MTDQELRERAIAALARVRATTPRPWFREMEQDGETLPDGTGYTGEWYEGNNIVTGPDGCGDIGYAQRASDAAFFVAAPDDVEVLANAVLRLLEPVSYRPGLPSAEQVRAHEARGGWWLIKDPDGDLSFGSSFPDGTIYRHDSGGWMPTHDDLSFCPCYHGVKGVPDGTPCPWLDEGENGT